MLDDLSYMVPWLIRWVVVSGFVVKPGTLRHKRTARKSFHLREERKGYKRIVHCSKIECQYQFDQN